MKRVLVIVLGLALVAAIVYGFLPKPVACEFTTVTRDRVLATIDAEGQTRVKDRFTVTTPISGMIARVSLRAGDRVSQDDTITTLTPPDAPLLDARSLAEARATLRAAEAALRETEAQVTRTQAELTYATTSLTRVLDLRDSRHVSQDEVDVARTRQETADAAHASAGFARQVAVYQVEAARATLDPPERAGGGSSPALAIRAPVSGRVLRVHREDAGVVERGQALVEIGDPSSLEIVVDFLSRDAVRLHPGMSAIVERWGGDPVLDATVRTVEPSGFTKTSALGVEEQRVNVLLDITSPIEERASLGDGYRVEVRAILADRTDVIAIPSSALFDVDEGQAVFVVVGGRAERRVVTTGIAGGRVVEIAGGLDTGETIILNPPGNVSDGTRVNQR